MSENDKYVVSACLAGVECRYDCQSKTDIDIVELVKNKQAIAVCPEELGGLSTPRDPAEQVGDKIISNKGVDVSSQYKNGAQKALEIARDFGATKAILKSKSPMCGIDEVYDGTFSGKLTKGDGVFAKLLKSLGFEVSKK